MGISFYVTRIHIVMLEVNRVLLFCTHGLFDHFRTEQIKRIMNLNIKCPDSFPH